MNNYSKAGRHGTLHLYRVSYQDDGDEFNGGSWHVYAYSTEDAIDRFYSDPDSGGWGVTGASRVQR